MATAGEILRYARKRAGLTIKELADRSGVSTTTICHLETGRTKPIAATVWAIVNSLGFSSLEQMARAIGTIGVGPQVQNVDGDIPVLADIPAGRGDFMDENGGSGVAQDYIKRSLVGCDDPRAYAVRVRGDSMMPTIAEGDVIICSPSIVEMKGFEDGMIYAMRFGMEDEATVKRVQYVGQHKITLIPDNPRHPRRTIELEAIHHAARVVAKLSPL